MSDIREEIAAVTPTTSWGLRILPDELYGRALPWVTSNSKFFNVPLYKAPTALRVSEMLWGGLSMGYLVKQSDYVPADYGITQDTQAQEAH